MTMEFQTEDLTLIISEEDVSFELRSNTFEETLLRSHIEVQCHAAGSTHKNLLSASLQIEQVSTQKSMSTPAGEIQGCVVTLSTELPGVRLKMNLGLSAEHSLAFVQLKIINNSDTALTFDRISPLVIQPADLKLGPASQPDPAFFSNGWQSWSSTGSYTSGDRQNSSILGPFQNPMVVNSGTPQPNRRNHFTGDMFGVLGDRSTRIGLLAGFLSQLQHFGSLETCFTPAPSLSMWANGDRAELLPGKSMETDWAVLSFIDLEDREPMRNYLRAVTQAHQIATDTPIPVGWCSWYHFYEAITQENIEANLSSVIALKPKLPLQLFQIDDGFETRPGDWFDFDPAFPDGLTSIVEKTRAAGLTPGIWLAPFIVHPKAKLVKDHPDWLLRDQRGKLVNAGFVWNAFTYPLDLTNPDALDYCCRVVRTAVEQWGFEYLKLDFLYAAALDGAYQDPTLTRAQVLRRGLAALRDSAGPEITMLACGCPLGSALGLFEAMRISADVSGHWEPHFPPLDPLLKKEPHMPAARNAVHNILTRAMLHQHWWINDPDCLLVRPDTELTLAEVQTLATTNAMTGGSLLLSDDLPALPNDRLKLAQLLLPIIGQRAQVLDWMDAQMPSRVRLDLNGPIGEWYLLALFNWDDKPAPLAFTPEAFNLPEGETWWLREFWTGAISQMGPGSQFTCEEVPAHGVRLVAARRCQEDQGAYLGSDIHISQGIEIHEWHYKQNELSVHFKLDRQASGQIFVYLPWQPASARIQDEKQRITEHGRGIYSISLEDVDGKTLLIRV